MSSRLRWLLLAMATLALLASALPGLADHGTRPIVGPLQPLGDSPNVVASDLGANGEVNSDLAFWGNRVYQGTWNGFRVIDVSNPSAPVELLNYEQCAPGGNQGDIIVWENILVRSWNSNVAAPGPMCDGLPVPVGFEGLHVFDISNLADPALVASIDLPQGSHTATAVPDLANNRLLVYNSASSANNPGLDIVQVPLAAPATSSFIRFEPAGRSCHDTQVFLGDVLRTVCAGGNGFTMWSMDAADGGSLTNPRELFSKKVEVPDIQDPVGIGHSAAFSWDGKMFAFGHEPGGGTDDQCDADDREINRTQFYFETETGKLLGTWTMNPPQTPDVENCTVHNYNFIPTLSGRDIVVGGHYQAGTWVVDVTDPQNPRVIARADPPPLDPNTLVVGGAWSSYWYNGLIYESEITKGLHIFRLNIPDTAPGRYRPEAFSNPQTQMESIKLGRCKGRDVTLAGTSGNDTIAGTSLRDVISGRGGKDRINGLGDRDTLCGGAGTDRLRGAGGNDRLFGQAGNDRLNGGAGRDRCVGGGGTDRARNCEKVKSIEA